MRADILVSTQWLADHIQAPDIVVVDASWYLPSMGRDARAEYNEAHIPGAIFFDIDAITDTNSDLPHMLPPPHIFSSFMRKLGIGDGQTIIVYDNLGLFSAPRVWWTFRAMGAKHIFVLDGGFSRWKEEGRPFDDRPVKRPERHFTARLDHRFVRNFNDVMQLVQSKNQLSNDTQIVDARSAERFMGEAPEPRAGLRSGHIPGSLNLPFDWLIEDGHLKSNDALHDIFSQAGIDLSRPIITTCGSGVTASVLSLALAAIDTPSAIYDGSWAEWGGQDNAPIE